LLVNPLTRGRAITFTFDQFTYGWTNALDDKEAKELYDTFHVAGSGIALVQMGNANLNPWTEAKVDHRHPPRPAPSPDGQRLGRRLRPVPRGARRPRPRAAPAQVRPRRRVRRLAIPGTVHSPLAGWALATELHGQHSVLWTTGELAEPKAILLAPRLLRRSVTAALRPVPRPTTPAKCSS
jgi:hypothetical protein